MVRIRCIVGSGVVCGIACCVANGVSAAPIRSSERFDELRVGDRALLLVPLAPFYEGRDSLAAAADRRAHRRADELSGAAK
jgi:hypothetical protein